MTRGRRIPGFGTIFTALLCVGLAGLVYAEFERPPIEMAAPQAARSVAASSPPAPRGADMPAPSREIFAEIATRTLFNPDRRLAAARPIAPPPAPPVPPPAPTPAFAAPTLMGVLISEDKRIAVLRVAGTTEALRLAEGEGIQGWIIKHVRPDKVTLLVGAAEHDVPLVYERMQSAPTMSGAPAAPLIIGPMPAPPR
jgi:hypothetical protein